MRSDATQKPSHPERGAAMVEFAVILPVLLMVLFGIIEFGLAISKAHTIQAAAHEAARVAAVAGSTAEVTARAELVLGESVGSGLTISGPCGASDTLRLVEVTIRVPHTISVPLVNEWNINLESTATTQCQT